MFSAWHKQVAGWAILAQAASPPAIMILFWVVLWCAGSFQFDVSGAVRRNAHGHHQGAEGSLWVAQRSSGGLHCDCRRLEGRHKVAGSAPRPCGDCSLGEVTTGGWQLPQCCASFSCGAGVEPSETNSAHQERWRLGLLDRRFTFSRAEDDGSLGGDDDYTRGPTGEKVQDGRKFWIKTTTEISWSSQRKRGHDGISNTCSQSEDGHRKRKIRRWSN